MPKYPEHVLVKFPEGTREAVKAAAGEIGSQEFIRRAVAAALDGGKAVPDDDEAVRGPEAALKSYRGLRETVEREVLSEKPEQVAASSAHCKERILGVLTGPRSILQISRSTAIFPGRIEKEVRALEKAGLVRWVDGMVERV